MTPIGPVLLRCLAMPSWGLRLTLLLALLLVALHGRPGGEADAAGPVTLTGPVTGVPGIPLSTLDFDDAQTALSGPDPTVVVPVPGFGTLSGLDVGLAVDETTHTITLTTPSPQQVPGLDVLGAVDIRVMLLATWEDPAGTPSVFVALRLSGQPLDAILPGWGSIPGVDDATVLSDTVILLGQGGPPGFSLDPSSLPADVNAFLGVDGPLAEELLVEQVATLAGILDLDQNEVFAKVAAFLGIDPNAVLPLAGALAADAAFLFDAASLFDEDAFDLRAPITLETPSGIPWLDRVAPEFHLTIESGIPSVRVMDEFTVTTAGVQNTFSYDVSLAEAQDLSVTVNAAPANQPYDLGALGVSLESFTLAFDEASGQFSGAFNGLLQAGGTSAPVIAAVDADPETMIGIVTVDGTLPIGDAVAWLAGTPVFSAGDFSNINFASATLSGIEFSFNSSSGEAVFGLYSHIEGIDALGADNLCARFLLGVDTAPALAVLGALRIEDEGCDGDDTINVSQVFPLLAGSLAVDFELPAINLVGVTPSGATFSTASLGPVAQAFLAEVHGGEMPEPYTIPGELNFIADIPLDGLEPLLGALGMTPQGDTVHVQGSAGFSFAFLDGGSGSLDLFRASATLPGFKTTEPNGFPVWLGFDGTGDWELFLEFEANEPGSADDTLAMGVAIGGITQSLVAGVPDLTLEAKFSGTGLGGPGADWTITATAAFEEAWDDPFGLGFLTIEEAAAVLTLTPAEASASLCGLVDVGGVDFKICAAIASLSPPTATLTVELLTPVTLQDVLDALPPELLGGVELPDGIGDSSFGPGKVEFEVVDTGAFRVGAVADVEVVLFGQSLPLEILLMGSMGGGSDPFGAVGLKLQPGTTLGELIGQPGLPVDLPLAGPDLPPGEDPTGGFAFVFASAPIVFDSADLPQAAEEWFLPLFGGNLEGQQVTGIGVIGAFTLPEPLSQFMQGLGIDPNVLVAGSIEFEPLSVSLSITLRLYEGPGAELPEIIDGASLTLSVGLNLNPPALVFGLSGTLDLRLKQGMDEQLAETLGDVGLDFPAAEEVNDPGYTCPRGGALQHLDKYDDTSPLYCYDRLSIVIGTSVAVEAGPPPSVTLTMKGDLTSMNANDGGWSPLGLTIVEIDQIGAELDLSFASTGGTNTVTVKVGVMGDVTVAGKTVALAAKVGATVNIIPSPPFFGGFVPLFEGFRIALPQGVSAQEFVDLQSELAAATGTAKLEDFFDVQAVPNFALKNLYLSISLLGVPSLCIEQGFVLKGDLWIDPVEPAPVLATPNCVPNAPLEIPQAASCEANKPNGCVAQVNIEFTLNGIVAQGFLAGFEIPELEMRFDDALIAMRLTFQDQYIRIHGGVEIGPEDNPTAVGRMSLAIEPTQVVFAGQLGAFGFNALVSGSLVADPLDVFTSPEGFNPTLTLHVVLAAPELSLPQYGSDFPDFSERVRADLERTIDDVAEVIEFIEETVDDFSTDPLGTLVALPARLQEAGYDQGVLPGWVALLDTAISDADTKIGARDASYDLEDLVNGFPLPGIEIPKLTCGGYIDENGTCWGVRISPPVCTGFTVEGDSKCYLWPPLTFADLCETTGLFGQAADDGYCTEEELEDQLEEALAGIIAEIEAFSGVGNLSEVIDTAGEWLSAPSSTTVFALQCAALDLDVSLLGNNRFDVDFDATLLGAPLQLGFAWDFDDPLGSAAGLLVALLGGGSSTPCVGADEALFGETGLGNPDAAHPEDEALPPLTLNLAIAPAVINEGERVSATVELNRAVSADDDSPAVTINWGDGSAASVVAFAVGDRTKEIEHVYTDDNPSGTTSDTYTASASLAGAPAVTDTAAVTVKNVAPSNVALDLDSTAINENDQVTLTVDWDDPGADSHSLRIEWGDGSVTNVASAEPGDSFVHRYLDDRPTASPADDVTLRVRVRDDDGGSRTASTELRVSNVAPDPESIEFSLTEVEEGGSHTFTLSWDDPGTRDTFLLQVDWDGDGVFEESHSAGWSQQIHLKHQFVDDHPETETPWDDLLVRVRVVDDDTGQAESAETVRVNNVAPVLCIAVDPVASDPVKGESCPGPSLAIDEWGEVTVRGVYQDPGILDTHIVTIDWGFEGFDDTTVTFAPSADEPDLDGHAFTASQVYGDNGEYTITVTVGDDDTGVAVATATVTIGNIDPAVEVDETLAAGPASPGTIMADGPDDNGVLDTPTFVARAGEQISLPVSVTDPGSDDLALTWDWDDGTVTTEDYPVGPVTPDPLPSPQFAPRELLTAAAHTWSQACLYHVTIEADDDDGGSGDDSTWVVVTGTDDRIRAPGWWYNQYDTRKTSTTRLDDTTLACYLQVVAHMSRVFNSFGSAATFEEARDVLNTKKTSDDRQIMTRQLLAAWLNLAHGSVRWFDMVDTNRDKIPDQRFGDLMLESETLRLDDTATRSALLAQEDKLKSANGD